jgi:uncharacterized membrane protein
MENEMTNFFHAFFVIFCLMSFGIISLALGLGLINPVLGVLAIVSCVVGIYSTAGALE